MSSIYTSSKLSKDIQHKEQKDFLTGCLCTCKSKSRSEFIHIEVDADFQMLSVVENSFVNIRYNILDMY